MQDQVQIDHDIIAGVRTFVEKEVLPVASDLEHRNEYPQALVDRMKELGLFGATIPEEYGGLGLSVSTYAMVVEELCRGWMSLSGILNTHLMMAYLLRTHGTEEQKRRFLPAMARGEKRAALGLTEPHAGSDAQQIRTTAVRRGDAYYVNGSKMWSTNARTGTMFALVAKTDPKANPPHKGISVFVAEKGHAGCTISRDLPKLGYKGVESAEVAFEDFPIPAENLIGKEGEGFKYVMAALEVGRVNIAARAVGVAQAAFEAAIKYAQERETFGKPICEHQAIQLKLADMATKIEAARLLTRSAAAKKDRGERSDVEAGMAKLFASEICHEVALEAMRIHGGYGYSQEFPVERYYRDAPLMIIGEGTNEIQRLVIARGLLARAGYRTRSGL
ncbi:MAG TPA: acyl-CoA dehydrogenase family protein [Candidatus Bathyarchaeia archaeon]|nr:acyl-CoA dehydrogenase family protein [Candidatus Bathyarchaeia archaeon]